MQIGEVTFVAKYLKLLLENVSCMKKHKEKEKAQHFFSKIQKTTQILVLSTRDTPLKILSTNSHGFLWEKRGGPFCWRISWHVLDILCWGKYCKKCAFNLFLVVDSRHVKKKKKAVINRENARILTVHTSKLRWWFP